jgi:hypothetical protein
MRCLLDVDFVADARFLCSDAMINDMSEHEVDFEDELASTAGAFALSLVKHRLRRVLYMVATYPYKLVLLLGEPHEQVAVLSEFKKDAEIYDKLSALPQTASTRAVLSRSCFNHLCVQQLLAGAKSSNFEVSDELVTFVGESTKTVMQSQGVEDMNNSQKNSRQATNWGSRYRRPQTGMAVCIRNHVHNAQLPRDPAFYFAEALQAFAPS